jgi:DNA primase
MAFSEQFLDDIRHRIGLTDLIGRRVRLIRRGHEASGLCPFHNEKTPSFTVNEQKGFFHCFGCGANGTLFDFVMRMDNVGFAEAVTRLAAEAGLSLPDETPEEKETARRRQTLHDASEAAAAFFERALRMPVGTDALAYLRRRGLDDDVIRRFRLGFAADGGQALRTGLARDGFEEATLIEAGLVIRSERPGGGSYDRFRGRVMFPIRDRRGRVVGFGGRVLGAGEPKYLNSPETPLFQKGRLLYNLDQAAAAVRRAGTLLVVEGYMDVIGLARAGRDGVVAPLGTALTEDQLRSLWALTAEPVLCFDPDAAGHRAALRAAEKALALMRSGFGLRFAFLSTQTGDDPDGVARRYPVQFMDRAIADAVSLSELLFSVEAGDRRPRTAEARAALQQRLRQRASQAADGGLRAHLERTFRERLWALSDDRRDLKRGDGKGYGRDGEQGGRRRPRLPDSVAEHAPGAVRSVHDADRTLLAIIIKDPAFFHQVEEDLGSVTLADGALDRLRQDIISLLSGAAGGDSAALKDALAERGSGAIADDILDDPVIRRHPALADDADEVGRRALWDRCLAAVKRRQERSAGPAADGTEPTDAEKMARLRALRLALDAADD